MRNMKRVLCGIVLLLTPVLCGCRSSANVIGQDVISQAEFYRLSEGMTMAQVQETIGVSGLLQTSSNAFENYEWKNSDGSKAIIVFKDGQLYRKNWYSSSYKKWLK